MHCILSENKNGEKTKTKRQGKQKPFAELINNKATRVETVEIN